MYFTIENPDVKMIEQLELAKNAAEKAKAEKQAAAMEVTV